MKDMLEAGVHFGHQVHRWNPKMKKYIFAEKSGIHIFDLEKTAVCLNRALAYLKKQASEGKTILFVSTKTQTADILPTEAKHCGMPYVTNRWLGGTLTNFKTIKRRIDYLKDLEKQKASGDLEKKYTKKEALLLDRQMEKLNQMFGGLKEMTDLPETLFVIDGNRDKTALLEAQRMNITTVGIADSNTDPDLLSYPIPGNDDAVRALTLMIHTVSEVIGEGKAQGRLIKERPAMRPQKRATPDDKITKIEVTAADLSDKEI